MIQAISSEPNYCEMDHNNDMASTYLPLKPILISFLLAEANPGRQEIEFIFHVWCKPTGKVSTRCLYWQYLLNACSTFSQYTHLCVHSSIL